MAGLTNIPAVGGTLGPQKSDRPGYPSTDPATELVSSEWNASAKAIEEMAGSMGLGTGATPGTIEAERMKNAAEIAGALADGDFIPVTDVSDTSKVKKALLSRIRDWLLATVPIASGTWTPTVTAVLNVTSTSSFSGFYIQIGAVVACAFIGTVTPTAAGHTKWRMSLPTPSAFTNATQAAGVLNTDQNNSGRIHSDDVNDQALGWYSATASGSGQISWGMFMYRVL